MRRFLTIVTLVALPVLAVLLAIEVLLRRIPNDYSYKASYIEQHGDQVKVLVLGSSHSYRGVDTEVMECPGFNAANISQTYVYDLAMYRHFAGRLTSLEWIVLPASYASLALDMRDGAEAWRIKNYVIYCGLSELARKPAHVLELLNHPFAEEIRMILDHQLHGMDNRVCLDGGAGPEKHVGKVDPQAAANTALRRQTANDPEVVARNRAALEDLIELARRNGARIYLFIPPAERSYRLRYDPQQLDTLISTCTALAERYDHVAFRDLLDDPRFLPSDFSDVDHLNRDGATKLSLLIADDLKCR